MKTTMEILRISAGKIESNEYASVIIIDETCSDTITADRIDVGQQHAKVRLDTSNSNRLATLLAQSGLVPGRVEVEIKTSVRAGEASIQIVGFTDKKAA